MVFVPLDHLHHLRHGIRIIDRHEHESKLRPNFFRIRGKVARLQPLMQHAAHGGPYIDQNNIVPVERLAEFVQLVDVIGGLDGQEVGLGQHRMGGAVGIIQIEKLMRRFDVVEIQTGEDGGKTFADATLGLRADDKSFHVIPSGLIFVPAGGGLLLVDGGRRSATTCQPVGFAVIAGLRQWFRYVCRWLPAFQLHPELLDFGTMLTAEPRYAEERGFYPDFLQHGHDLVVGRVLGPEQDHAALILIENAAPCFAGIKRFRKLEQRFLVDLPIIERRLSKFVLHMPFIAHPGMNRKVSFE
jgi:hypothetical protein